MEKLKSLLISIFKVPVFLVGMPPSIGGDDNSGATIYLFTKTETGQDKHELGKADENGEYKGMVSRKYIGKEVYLRI